MNYWKEATRHWFFKVPKRYFRFLFDAADDFVNSMCFMYRAFKQLFHAFNVIILWFLPLISIPIIVGIIKDEEKAREKRNQELENWEIRNGIK